MDLRYTIKNYVHVSFISIATVRSNIDTIDSSSIIMIKSSDDNYCCDGYKPIHPRFDDIAQHISQEIILNNDSEDSPQNCAESQKIISENVDIDIPITDYNNLPLEDSSLKLNNSVDIPHKKCTLSGDSTYSFNLSPARNKSSLSTCAQDMSPILESGFRKCWKGKKIVSSTPGDLHNISSNPENINMEVLSALDILCSPVTKKNTSNRVKPVKRLFDSTSDITLECKTKRKKYEANSACSTGKNLSFNESSDPFQEHNISERTLIAICEGTKHLVENVHQDQSQIESSMIYDSDVKEIVESNENKISLNDLLKNVKILEYANKLIPQHCETEKCKRRPKNISGDAGFVRVEPVSSTLIPETNLINKESLCQPLCTKEQNVEQLLGNDTIGITDTQFCEVVEAAEMVTHLNNSANDVKNYKNCLRASRENLNLDPIKSCLVEINQDLNTSQSSGETVCENLISNNFSTNIIAPEENFNDMCNRELKEIEGKVFQQPNLKSSKFKGFNTANGKSVTVSHESLKRARQLFLQDDIFYHKTCLTEPKTDCLNNIVGKLVDKEDSKIPRIEVQTASANSDSMSDVSQSIAKEMLQQDLVGNSSDTLECSLLKESDIAEGRFSKPQDLIDKGFQYPYVKTNRFEGFNTASGKFVNISKESLTRANKLFLQDFNYQESCLPEVSTNELNNTVGKLIENDDENIFKYGNKTANDKSVSTSDFTLQIAKEIFHQDNQPLNKASNMVDFKTSQELNVADDCVSKRKEILFVDSHNQEKTSGFEGFNTASGKSVSVSKASLTRARQLLLQDDNWQEICFPKVSNTSVQNRLNQILEDDKSMIPKMKFKTSSGKCNSVSDFSLHISKEVVCQDSTSFNASSMLKSSHKKQLDIAENSVYEPSEIIDKGFLNHNMKPAEFKGLNTACGKHVSFSKESLKDENCEEMCLPEEPTEDVKNKEEKLVEKDKPNIPKIGFQTAGGKSVSVSDFSLRIAKEMLYQDCFAVDNRSCVDISTSIQELNNAKNLFRKPKEASLKYSPCQDLKTYKFEGFNTASGKSVNVSKDSLSKARQLFLQNDKYEEVNLPQVSSDDVNNKVKADEFVEKVKSNISKIGFQTASGKSVSVSDASLEIAKEMFCQDRELDIEASYRDKSTSTEELVLAKNFVGQSKEILFNDSLCHNINTSKFKGFNTANGKYVNVSKESLTRARQLFLQDDKNQKMSLLEVSSDDDNNKVRVDKFTKKDKSKVSGNELQTDLSLKIAKETLGQDGQLVDEASIRDKSTIIQEFCIAQNYVSKPTDISLKGSQYGNIKTQKFEAFNTASGKSVSVSKESLSKAKQIFIQNTNHDQTCEFDVKNKPNNNTNFLSDGPKLNTYSTTEKVDASLTHSHHFSDNYKVGFSENHCKGFASLLDGTHVFKAEKCNNKSDELNSETVVLADSTLIQNKIFQSPEENCTKLSMSVIGNTALNKKYSESDMAEKDTLLRNINKKNLNSSILQEDSTSHKFPLSVISEDDLSLLNQSVSHNPKVINFPIIGNKTSYPNLLSTSIDREVSESMAALVADEESNSPFSKLILKPIITSPAIMFERPVRLPSIVCDDNNMQFSHELSPVLDSNKYFKPTKSLKKKLFDCVSSEAQDNKVQAPNLLSTPDFKPPYATSTPKETLRKTKHSLDFEDMAPSSKRLKTEPRIQAQDKDEVISPFVKEARKKAAMMQEKHVQDKIKSALNIKPCKGLYWLKKQSEKRNTLKSLTGGHSLHKKSLEHVLSFGVSLATCDVTANTAIDFKFSASYYFSHNTASGNVDGVSLGDNAMLVLSAEGYAGVTELTRAFQDMPTIDPNLAQSSWVANHYRWIVLKLASMERMFPESFANRCLTPNNVMLQLKYRYDREVDLCQRPALRKILEKDETPARTMVLFVADILIVQNKDCGERTELELSDGWYSVRTSIDIEMETFIRRNKVGIGTKLVVSGAELIGNGDGCSPLETPSDVRLKLSTNSCRRARWHSRLGLLAAPLPPLELRAVLPRGGAIQQLAALVARVYPLLFREKLPDGRSVVRGERAEQAAEDAYQLKRQQSAETILSQLQRDMEKSSGTNKKSAICSDEDISLLKESMNSEEIQWIQEKNFEESSRIQEKMQDQLSNKLDETMPRRNVTRMLKVRLVSSSEDSHEQLPSCRSAVLTVWNPSDDVLSVLAEGNSLVFHHLTASGYSRFGDMQLTGGRNTRYSITSKSSVTRTTTSLSSLRDSSFAPPFSEVDLVGLVLQVGETSIAINKSVYIADADYNFLCISFGTEIKETGYKNVLSPGNLVAISSLRWRSHLVSWSLPNAFASESTSFTQNPRLPHLQKSLAKLRQLTRALDLKCYMEDCSGRIEYLIKQRNSGGMMSSNSRPDRNPANSSRLLEQQDISKSDMSECSKALCDSFDQNTSVTPQNKRLLLLERFGEPPPISPLPASTPRRVKRNFRPPTRKSSSESLPR